MKWCAPNCTYNRINKLTVNKQIWPLNIKHVVWFKKKLTIHQFYKQIYFLILLENVMYDNSSKQAVTILPL